MGIKLLRVETPTTSFKHSCEAVLYKEKKIEKEKLIIMHMKRVKEKPKKDNT